MGTVGMRGGEKRVRRSRADRRRRLPQWFALAVTLVGFVGCGLNPGVRTTPGDEGGLLFGYFDVQKSDYYMGQIYLTQDERSGIAYRQSPMQSYHDGLFFQEGLPPMKYHVPFFYLGGDLHMLSTSEDDMFEVGPGEFHFYGAYRYEPISSGFVEYLTKRGKYGLAKASSPTESDVLKMVRDRIESSQWKARITAHLEQLEAAEKPAEPEKTEPPAEEVPTKKTKTKKSSAPKGRG